MSKLAANNIQYSSKSVAEQAGFSLIWSKTLKTDFSCFEAHFKGNSDFFVRFGCCRFRLVIL